VVKARFNVLTNVRQRFYTALAAQQRVEVLDRLVAIAGRAAQISERVFKADLGTRGDVLLLEIELSRAEAQRSSAAALGEAARRQLAAATGVIDLPIARVEGDLKLPLPDYDVIGVQQAVLARNSQLRSAELEIARSQLVLRRQEVEPFPNLNLMGGYQNQQPGAGAPQSQGMYQVEMVVPLFNRNQGNIRAAQASVGTAMARLQRVQTELADAAAAAVGRYQAARQILDRYEREILPKARRLEGIYSGLYAEAQVDFLRYLAAQRALLDADLSSVNAQEARWMAAVEIAGLLQAERFP
jgi:cobalt-zinc-cadmium efflux system outer membrane protein